jgi:general nucleoside transport system permease protein
LVYDGRGGKFSLVEIIETALIVGLIAGAIKLSVPLLLTSLGELVSERSGVLNLGLEGIMIMGAFTGFISAVLTGSVWAGFAVGMVSGIAMALLLPLISETLRANQIVTGLGIFILGSGLSLLFFRTAFEGDFVPTVQGLSRVDIAGLSNIPIIGPILFQHDIMVYITISLVPIFYYIIFHTRFGLSLRSVGENPLVAETLGLNPTRIRYYAVIVSGALAGLGGAYLSLEYARKFTEGITAGMGFVALAVVILGRWNPIGALLAALLFAGSISLQLRLQGIGVEIPPQFFFMIPYILTIAALLVVSRAGGGPQAIGEPYVKEK